MKTYEAMSHNGERVQVQAGDEREARRLAMKKIWRDVAPNIGSEYGLGLIMTEVVAQ